MDFVTNLRCEVSYRTICLFGGVTEDVQSVVCGFSCSLQWRVGSWQGDVCQPGEFPLPDGPSLNDVKRKVCVIPAPLLRPQLLNKYFGPRSVGNNDSERVILPGKHLVYVAHSGSRVLH